MVFVPLSNGTERDRMRMTKSAIKQNIFYIFLH